MKITIELTQVEVKGIKAYLASLEVLNIRFAGRQRQKA